MQDIEIGVEDLDKDFVIKGSDESKVKELLEDPSLRFLIQSHPSITLKLEANDGGEILFTANGRITDIPRLKSLFQLFQEALDRLVRTGSAY